jgi:diacylglycerol kinase (ATP)
LQLIQSDTDFQVTVFNSQAEKHAIQLTKEAAEKQVDYIVSIGGDGTCNEVVNGFMQASTHTSTLAFIPNGTGNDFVNGQKLIFKAEKVIKAIKANSIKSVDIGEMIKKDQKAYFINIADIGFGGVVVNFIYKKTSFKKLGKFAYIIALLINYPKYKKPTVRITSPNFLYEGKLFIATFCNSSRFGGGFVANPYAKIDDGKMHYTIFGDISFGQFVKNIAKLKSGKPIIEHNIHYLEDNEVQIEILKGDAFLEMDGELFGDGNTTIKLIPNAIQMLFY